MTTMSAGATAASAPATAPDAAPMTDAHVAPPASADQRMQALYRAHARPLYRFLLRITFGDSQAAEDLLQETLLRAWRHLDGLPVEADTLRSWLFTVGRRVAIDAARARGARPVEVGVADLSALSGTDDPIERLMTVQTVRQAMTTLNPEHRGVLIELYYRERSTAEAAARLGIPVGTVKSRTHYALRSLSAAIGAAR